MASQGIRYTAEQVAKAITDSNGIKAVAARRLGCARNTVVKYANEYAICREAVQTSRETVVDLAEGKLIEAIGRGEPWAVALVLKTLGKERGYGDSVEIILRQAKVLAEAYNLDPGRIIDVAQKRHERAS